MAVSELSTVNFRNLASETIQFHPKINFFIGDNGSGKSSLLESLFFLGHGKSFRSHHVNNLINNDGSWFVVSAKTEDNNQLGIKRNNQGESTIKINGQKCFKLSDLAKNFAVQIITPESFKLFFGGPKQRRKFVDLGLFHVKHSFSKVWKQFNKVHKQRNALLKKRATTEELEYWNSEFCRLSEIIAAVRLEYIDELKRELEVWLELFFPDTQNKISLQYLQGWNSKKDLNNILAENRTRELEKGYALYGAHKFDLRLTLNRQSLEDCLSRGQQKLFLLALTFAQTKLIEQVNRVKPILLIDDIGAELDANSRKIIAELNQRLDCQTVITAIEKGALEPLLPKNKKYEMFHVKHGQISAMSK